MRGVVRACVAVLVLAAAAGTACASIAGLTGGASGDGGTSDSGMLEAASDTRTPDVAPPDAVADSAVGTDTGSPPTDCPTGFGASMVKVPILGTDGGFFCVDSTEATQAQYLAFLDASADVAQPSECAWNTSYTNISGQPNDSCPATVTLDQPSYPVACVDWCDAYAFCSAQGKHLCGKIGGGTTLMSGYNNALVDEWFAACSQDDDPAHKYPYGSIDAGDAAVCNTLESNLHHSVPAMTFPECSGGYPGLWDMSGNLFEWEDSCDPNAPDTSSAQCLVRGGSFGDGVIWCDCAGNMPTSPRDMPGYKIGIRCCAY